MHVWGVGKVALKYSGVNCTFLQGNWNKITSVNSEMFTLYIDTLKHEFTP
jgi:hypothetical protein